MAKKKLLFLTVPMQGHFVHTLRLVEWFLQYPEDYEVHVHAEEQALADFPSGAIRHVVPPPPGSRSMAEIYEETLNESGRAVDWFSSQASMLSSLSDVRDVAKQNVTMAIARVKEVQPDAVICDHGYNHNNFLHSQCKRDGIPLVTITSMGRRECLFAMKNTVMMLLKHFSAVKTALSIVSEINQSLEAEYGKPLPERESPVGIFPSSELLVQGSCPRDTVHTGPFIPLPDQVPVSPEEGWPTLERALADKPKLARWLQEGGSTPMVYLAFGTLVKASEDLINRLVEGLNAGNWRVLWSLPSSLHSFLPKQGLSDQWFVESYVPQAALLGSGLVRVFLSHGGANSTHESLAHGVPMVCMPFYGDQYESAESVCRALKVGVRIDKLRSQPDDIRSAVTEVLEKPMYRANAEALARQMKALSLKRLQYLKKPGKLSRPFNISSDLKVGVPVAAAVIEACLRGDDPQTVVAQVAKARTFMCWTCR